MVEPVGGHKVRNGGIEALSEREREAFTQQLAGLHGIAAETVDNPPLRGVQTPFGGNQRGIAAHSVYDERLAYTLGQTRLKIKHKALTLGRTAAQSIESTFAHGHHTRIASGRN